MQAFCSSCVSAEAADWREREQREGEREMDLHEVPSMGRQLRLVG